VSDFDPDRLEIAAACFEAHAYATLENTDAYGDPLPWVDLPKATRDVWIAVADVVLDLYEGYIPDPGPQSF
jgi:hypothetical protein